MQPDDEPPCPVGVEVDAPPTTSPTSDPEPEPCPGVEVDAPPTTSPTSDPEPEAP